MTTATAEHELAHAEVDLAALYAEHGSALVRYCATVLRNPDEAADAAQQTWVRALERLERRGEELRSIKHWLFVVARNECFDLIRRRNRYTELDERVAVTASVEEEQESHEDLAEVLLDLDRISERQRRAIVMRELGGMSYEEVADKLDTSLDAARDLTSEARAALNERRSGRAEDCSSVRERLDHSRAPRPGHFVLGHLDNCRGCKSYHAQARRRARSFAFAPLFFFARFLGATRGHGLRAAHGAHAVLAARSVASLATLAVGAGAVAVVGNAPAGHTQTATPRARAASRHRHHARRVVRHVRSARSAAPVVVGSSPAAVARIAVGQRSPSSDSAPAAGVRAAATPTPLPARANEVIRRVLSQVPVRAVTNAAGAAVPVAAPVTERAAQVVEGLVGHVGG